MGRVVVTGCAGFIGARVSELLLDEEQEVVGLDLLDDAYDPRLKQWRLARLEARSNFRFHRVDVSRADALDALPGDRCDAIFDLAARAGVRPSVERPQVYLDANVTGTVQLLQWARARAIPKLVLASTSSLYGNDNTVPYDESQRTDRPLSPYAATKKAAEVLAFSWHHLHGIDVSVLRYFTVYGPAGRPDMAPLRFTKRIAEDEEITVYGDGAQRRDFTFVDDVARATVLAARPLGYEIINVGGDRPVVLTQLIGSLERALGRTARIRHDTRHPADMLDTWAAIDKAERVLGWRPQIALEEGVERLASWYRAERDWARHAIP
ncbi:MAG: GDP-mannose 4,6-dehydratase [Deltaproteobacteria bacterium]|nr:GDP-mannose 4,6-dehydratase [Deltaproteobacteria bacterium]